VNKPSDKQSVIPNPNAGRVVIEPLESGAVLLRLGPVEERTISLTFARLDSMREALSQIKAQRPRGLIITGPSAEMFTVGADIGAIDSVPDAETGSKLATIGQRVFDELAALGVPSVAAISGPCMGGGCEMALACTFRIISDHTSSQIGLPETQLGILPGFGGTQRLPRLIGLEAALDIILPGRSLRPQAAIKAGLVDDVVPYEKLIERANSLINGAGRSKRTLKFKQQLLTFTKVGRAIVKYQASKKLHSGASKFYPAPPAALNAAIFGLENGLKLGLENEARELGRLIVTPESRNLVHIFKLTETAKFLGKSAKRATEKLHTIVVGAGAMGAGIAGALAKAECTVTLKDTTDASVKRGLLQIKTWLDRSRSLSERDRSFILNRIEATTRDLSNVGNAGFAIEAIFEELEVKRKVLGELATMMPDNAIIATNTSSLSVTDIAKTIPHPERVIGMHFFNPVEKMPLVEIIHGAATNDRAIAIVAGLTIKLGKSPIVVRDVPGFLVNRILGPYLTEAALLLGEGYAVNDIDRAATKFGMPMGPIRLLDEVGLDVAAHAGETLARAYPDRMVGPGFAASLVAAGRKGRKSGAGFYDFTDNQTLPHPGLREILKIQAAPIQSADYALITDRLIYSLIAESLRCYAEGVAGAPGADAAGQIDLGSVMGFGFPPFRGGVLRYARSLGAAEVSAKLDSLQQRFGGRFAVSEAVLAGLRS